MKTSVLEKTLSEQITPRLKEVTPGVQVRAYQAGKLVCDISVGETYPYYDFASITKVIFSVQSMMMAFEEKKWTFDTKVSHFLPWFPSKKTRVQDLLTHSSGLPWWVPFYKEINSNLPVPERWKQLQQMIATQEIEPKEVSLYSDVGILTLAFVLEEIFQKPLIDIWTALKEKFYNGTTMNFHPDHQAPYRKSLYAPTEECPWRQRVLQGEVHDENCWSLGGVSSHAGLFGSIDDLGWYLLLLRSQIQGVARYAIKQKTATLFSQRARPVGKGDWAMGYMMPTPGSASCGMYFSLSSVGHTGFTGTSAWYDPKADLAVAILSNRVAYGRENKAYTFLRSEIHNWIVEGLRKST
jgi:CubicO group peptidase (beta-lactamase class C family)